MNSWTVEQKLKKSLWLQKAGVSKWSAPSFFSLIKISHISDSFFFSQPFSKCSCVGQQAQKFVAAVCFHFCSQLFSPQAPIDPTCLCRDVCLCWASVYERWGGTGWSGGAAAHEDTWETSRGNDSVWPPLLGHVMSFIFPSQHCVAASTCLLLSLKRWRGGLRSLCRKCPLSHSLFLSHTYSFSVMIKILSMPYV